MGAKAAEWEILNKDAAGRPVSAWVAGRAGGLALLRTPAQAEPGQVAQLNDPGDGVCGNRELVIENGFCVH